jgi:hypothetical protein
MQVDRIIKRVINEIIIEIRNEYNYDLNYDVALKLLYYKDQVIKYGIENLFKIKIPNIGSLTPGVYKRFEHTNQSTKYQNREMYDAKETSKQEKVSVELKSGLKLMLPKILVK